MTSHVNDMVADAFEDRQLEYLYAHILSSAEQYRRSVQKALDARWRQRTWNDRHKVHLP